MSLNDCVVLINDRILILTPLANYEVLPLFHELSAIKIRLSGTSIAFSSAEASTSLRWGNLEPEKLCGNLVNCTEQLELK